VGWKWSNRAPTRIASKARSDRRFIHFTTTHTISVRLSLFMSASLSATRRVGQQRSGHRLLRTVGGKEHARNDDHVETSEEQASSSSGKETEASEDFDAEPQTSDDDPPRLSPPRATKPAKPIAPPNPPAMSGSNERIKPPAKPKAKRGAPRAPASGIFQRSQADKAKRGAADDKENVVSSQGSAQASQENVWEFSAAAMEDRAMELPPQKKQKTTFGSKTRTTAFNNIHGLPATTSKSKAAPRGYGKKAGDRGRGTKISQEVDDEPEMLDDEELDEALYPDGRKSPDHSLPLQTIKTKRPQKPDDGLKQPLLGDAELDEVLGEPTPNPTSFQNQLGDWMKDQPPASSQPNSSAPEEGLSHLDNYLGQLPEEEEEGSRCPICKALTNKDEYTEFWKGKKNTIKNQNIFCRDHRVKSAEQEYKSEKYPPIDWTTLSQRIKTHRMLLYQILNNDRSSEYRDRYEPIALTGKAAAVPSRRKDLPEHVQEELESYALDDQSTYPGYYGPHGRRVITENVMRLLKNEIKNCTDAVVQGSGPATFVQAVLVPETAILLIMEDCVVDREAAEEIREKTYEMGMLLNEEIEDQVEVFDLSDDDNEYVT
jgi:hypothetical protein